MTLPLRLPLLLGFLALMLSGCTLLGVSQPVVGQLAPEPPQLPDAPTEFGRVTEVVDGDTIRVVIDGEEFRVRYLGIDTPERDEACFTEATDANAAYVANQTVRLVRDVSDTDRYGRLLRFVYVDDTLVNAELVAGGWAESRRYEPDTRLYDYMEGLEATAVAQQRGCHPTGVFE